MILTGVWGAYSEPCSGVVCTPVCAPERHNDGRNLGNHPKISRNRLENCASPEAMSMVFNTMGWTLERDHGGIHRDMEGEQAIVPPMVLKTVHLVCNKVIKL